MIVQAASQSGRIEMLSRHNGGSFGSTLIAPELWRMSALAVAVCIILSASAAGQSYLSATGFPTFTTAVPVHNGVINAGNGNLYLNFPLGNYTQRGGKTVSLSLVYNGRIYEVQDNGSSKVWGPSSTGGWSVNLGYTAGSVTTASSTYTPCGASGYYVYSNYEFTDGDGTTRTFPVTTSSDNPITPSGCTLPYPTSATAYAQDSSGFFVNAAGGTGTVYYADGTLFTPKELNPVGGTADSTDTNGNITEWDEQGGILNDTIGRTILSVNNSVSPYIYSVSDSQGTGSRDVLNN